MFSNPSVLYFLAQTGETMIHPSLIHPASIVVVGGSNDLSKPGGKVLDNILRGRFQGRLSVLNPKETIVQGVPSYAQIRELPDADLAIVAISARYVNETVRDLIEHRNTRSVIVLSAGFGEESDEGKRLEKELVEIVASAGASLIGPNCIGVLTPQYQGVFTSPIPRLESSGCDFVSGSGSVACFIMEIGIPMGLRFASVLSVGNSAHVGIEEVLQYWDETFDPDRSSRIKLIYAEKIAKPGLFLHHAGSLSRKGCRIAAIKAGTSAAGIRAASSHTGALASSDAAVGALFDKAGVVRCHSKEEIANVAAVFMQKEPKGRNFAIVTNAGGPGVMAADQLMVSGLCVPALQDEPLLEKLHAGSSVANPIDFLATGTADQFKLILERVDNMNEVDAVVAIFGTPGMVPTFDAHGILLDHLKRSSKPIFAVLPSPGTAEAEMKGFLEDGGIFFRDEVSLANALGRVLNSGKADVDQPEVVIPALDRSRLLAKDGYLAPTLVAEVLDACGVPRVAEGFASSVDEAARLAEQIGFPLVMKVTGPLHKSDIGGVRLGVNDVRQVKMEYQHLMNLPGATGVHIQEMASGLELFAGVSYEEGYGHLVMCGLGGVLVEALKDVQVGLAPISETKAHEMIRRLRSARLFQEFRNQKFVDEQRFSDIIRRLSALVSVFPQIHELDLNPLMSKEDRIVAVDARIRVVLNDQT